MLVNARMQTGDPHIFAAGDVAEFEGQVPGLWPVAVAQAEIAADNAVGGTKLYDPVVPVTILKVVGIELTSIGRFEAAGPGEEEIALEDASGRYRKLVVADGRIVGAILLGFSKEVAAVRTAITRGFDVTHQLAGAAPGPLGRARRDERRNARSPPRFPPDPRATPSDRPNGRVHDGAFVRSGGIGWKVAASSPA